MGLVGAVALVAMGGLPAGVETPSAVLSAQDPEPFAFLLVTPSGTPAQVRSSELIAEVAEAFERHTDLRAQLVEAERVADCAGRLGCLVAAVSAWSPRPRALFVLSSIAGDAGRPDRLFPQWIDVDSALDALERGANEAEVRAAAVAAELPPGEVADREQAAAYLDQLVGAELRAVLEPRRQAGYLATLVVEGAPEGAALELDGQLLGPAAGSRVAVVRIEPGERILTVRAAGQSARSYPVRLTPGAHERIRLGDEARPARTGPERDIALVSGLVVAAAGAATLAVAAATAPEGTTVCEGCGDRFTVVGEAPPDRFGPPPEGPTGVPAAPLGAGLVLAGGLLAAGSQLEPGDGVPWWSILLGVAVGGAVTAGGLAF